MSLLDHLLLSKTLEVYRDALSSERKSEKTIQAYFYNLDLFKTYCGDISIREIAPRHIRGFEDSRGALKAATQHQAHRVLRTFCNWCVKEGFLDKTPMVNIKAPKLTRKIWDIYDRADIQKFFTQCPEKTFLGARNRAIIAVLIDTGMRENEIVTLALNDVDYKIGVIKIYFGKGDVERTVHISDKARQCLWRYILLRELKPVTIKPGQTEKLFVSEERRQLTAEGLGCIIKKIGKAAGVRRPGVHKFRHSCAISFLRNGGDLATLQYMLGHTSIATTMKYLTALNSDDVISAHKKFSPGDRFL